MHTTAPSGIVAHAKDAHVAWVRSNVAGFRLQAPKRGAGQPGVGKIRNAVERCHNFFAQFGRLFRRFDRSARHYWAWIEMAACVILLRSDFVS
jgi:transposase